jgi:hypothetical protein
MSIFHSLRKLVKETRTSTCTRIITVESSSDRIAVRVNEYLIRRQWLPLVPQRWFAVPATNPSTYNDKMQTCHPRAMANHARTRILINKQRFSKNFHRFFRGRDSMKEDRRIAAFRCVDL